MRQIQGTSVLLRVIGAQLYIQNTREFTKYRMLQACCKSSGVSLLVIVYCYFPEKSVLDFRSRLFPHKLSGDRDLMRIILLWEKTHFTTIYLHKIYMQHIVRVWYPTLLDYQF